MREEQIVKGIVLSTSLIGEFDKRLVILTKEKGKITAFAKGVRKPSSNMISACQTFVFGNFTVFEGRDAYTITSVEVLDYFSDISKDMIKVCYASYFGELLSYYTFEGSNAVQELNLLYLSLKALINNNINDSLIKSIFEIRLMSIEGQGIHSFKCVKCGDDCPTNYIDIKAGGIVCELCKAKVSKPIYISNTTLYTVKFITSEDLTKLFSFNLDEKSLREVEKISTAFINEYVDKKFKSIEILKGLTGI